MVERQDSPEEIGGFQRLVSCPAPASEEFPEKQDSFRRFVSDTGPEGNEKRAFRAKDFLKNSFRKASQMRRNSAMDLLSCLKEDAIKENKQLPWALIAAIVLFNVIGKIGDAIGPAMVGTHPLSLLFLNASNTHCILTTTTISIIPWMLVGVGRRFAEDPLYFYCGWKYRDACLGMLRNWSPDMADNFDKAESMFKNNLYFAVALNPGATVCSLAGASGMAPVAFFTLNLVSTAAQLLLMRYICSMFPGRIDDALEMIGKYMKVLLAIMVGVTLVGALPMLRKKKEHAE